jgi:LmbE family N-acetylglucosaminyl deacetylase
MNVEIKLFELSPEQQQRKHTACRAYKTQFNAFRAFKKPGAFRWEMIIRPKSSNKNE